MEKRGRKKGTGRGKGQKGEKKKGEKRRGRKGKKGKGREAISPSPP